MKTQNTNLVAVYSSIGDNQVLTWLYEKKREALSLLALLNGFEAFLAHPLLFCCCCSSFTSIAFFLVLHLIFNEELMCFYNNNIAEICNRNLRP